MTEPNPKIYLPPISPAAPGALYEQLVAGVKREISEGRLHPGSPLPSFRQLAADLMVSVITVKRAYEELEQEGIIFRRQGLGTFVAEQGADRSRDSKLNHARELIHTAAREALEAGIDQSALPQFFEETLAAFSSPKQLNPKNKN
jgi:GntR family transcriptional regulator